MKTAQHNADKNALAGAGIIVTRPIEQGKVFAKKIEQIGGKAILFPVIEICPPGLPNKLKSTLNNLSNFDIIIFVSANAVRAIAERLKLPLPTNLRVVAMGPATKWALERYGVSDIITPESGFDSEALLGLPLMQTVSGLRVGIFRGSNGREVLKDGLLQRGAKVEYVECYSRRKSDISANVLISAAKNQTLDAITVTSVEGLRNLVDILNGSGTLLQLIVKPLFVPHSRIAEEAKHAGWREVIVTGIGDDAMLTTLIQRLG